MNAFNLLHAFRIHEEKFLGLIVVRKSDFRASEKMRRRLFGNQSIGAGRNRRRIGVGAVKGNRVAVGRHQSEVNVVRRVYWRVPNLREKLKVDVGRLDRRGDSQTQDRNQK